MTEQTVLWVLTAVLIPAVLALWKVSRDEGVAFRSYLQVIINEDRSARAEIRTQAMQNQQLWQAEIAALTAAVAAQVEALRQLQEQGKQELAALHEIAERLRQMNGS